MCVLLNNKLNKVMFWSECYILKTKIRFTSWMKFFYWTKKSSLNLCFTKVKFDFLHLKLISNLSFRFVGYVRSRSWSTLTSSWRSLSTSRLRTWNSASSVWRNSRRCPWLPSCWRSSRQSFRQSRCCRSTAGLPLRLKIKRWHLIKC